MALQVRPDAELAADLLAEVEADQLYVGFGGGIGAFGTNFSVFSYNQKTIWR